MSGIRFDSIEPIEEPVHLGSVEYRLREISGEGKVRMENARLACYEYQEGKLVRVSNLADLEPLLVSLCLYDLNGVQVKEDVIRAWPARVQQALYDRARLLSGTNETKESLQKQLNLIREQLTEMESREQSVKN